MYIVWYHTILPCHAIQWPCNVLEHCVVESQKSNVSTEVIPCIKTELKYTENMEGTKKEKQSSDVRKTVSFQPQILERTRSYAEIVKGDNEKTKDKSRKYSLIDIYPKVKT